MIDQSHTVTIDRPAGEVFDFVAEPSTRGSGTSMSARVVRPEQGPITLGTTFEWVVRFLGTKRYVGEVTALEPNRTVSSRADKAQELGDNHSWSDERSCTCRERTRR